MYNIGEIVKVVNHLAVPNFLGKIKQVNEDNCLVKVAFTLGNNLIYKINNSNIVKIEDAPII
jgi:hypothetical protein